MCPDDYKLAAFIDAALTPEQSDEVETHLNVCLECMEKVFFLKKSLARENLFLKTPVFDKILIRVYEKGLEMVDRIGNIRTRPLETVFRDSPVPQQGLLVQMDAVDLKIEMHGENLQITPSAETDIMVLNGEERILFAGKTGSGEPVSLPLLDFLEIRCGEQTFVMECNNV